ncbi:MAG: hypothetical protein U0R50_00350 [Gaiellales bacterium]
MSAADTTPAPGPGRDLVAGLLAATSVALSGIGAGAGILLELDGHPGKTIPIAMLLAIISAMMSKRFQSMALKAVVFASIAWVVGLTIAVLTDAPLL